MMFKYYIFILLICKNASLISERFISKLFTSLKEKKSMTLLNLFIHQEIRLKRLLNR